MDLIDIPANPLPEGGRCRSVTTSDGLRLRAAVWPAPPEGPVKGTVCVFEGRAEFIEKYYETIADLRGRGFAVAALDWRGQGGSDRQLADVRKGHVDDFDLYAIDLDAFLTDVVVPDCPGPLFGLAHSMGGAALLLAIANGEKRFTKLVLSAPMTALAGLKFPRIARFAAAALDVLAFGGAYVPGGGATSISTKPFEGNILTSDAARYERTARVIEAAPGIAIGDPTIGWVNAAFRAMERLAARDFGDRLATPSLVLAAGSDPLIDSDVTCRMAERWRGARCVVIPGARHELLMERDGIREQVMAAFDAFVPGETVTQPVSLSAA